MKRTRQTGPTKLSIWLVVIALGGILGYFYVQIAYVQGQNFEGSPWLGAFIGFMIAGLSSGFEIFVIANPASPLRKLTFIPLLVVRVVILAVLFLAAIIFSQFIYDQLYGTTILTGQTRLDDYLVDLVFSMTVAGAIIFYLQMRLFIGARTLRNLILGKYAQPKSEQRIFMFIDVIGSTAVAQKIGDVRFHEYLNRLFTLFDEPIARYGGDIHSYVGDAIIATWPLTDNKRKNAKALNAAGVIVDLCREEADDIEEEFSAKPGIRIALHGGPVVAGETGFSKRQITYLGDTINITARIEAKAKEVDGNYLISTSLLECMELPDDIACEKIGEFDMKGASAKISLNRLQFN